MKRKRFFIPGDTWLYYKIYLVPFRSDWFLREVMFPLLMAFREKSAISKWYFLRYYDPEHHLRIRIKLSSLDYLTETLKTTREKIQPLIRNGRVINVQLDTYQREYERYGNQTITWCEDVFFHDSIAVVEMIGHTLDEGEDHEQIRLLSAIKSTAQYMNDFKMSMPFRKEYLLQSIHKLSDGMQEKDLLLEKISKKFRCRQKTVERTMSADPGNPAINIFEKRSHECKAAVSAILDKCRDNKPDVPLISIVSSIIHLSLNRIFPAYQLINELATYIFLFRYYKSLIAREKYAQRKDILLKHDKIKKKHKNEGRGSE